MLSFWLNNEKYICVKVLFLILRTHSLDASNVHLGQVVGKKLVSAQFSSAMLHVLTQ